VTQFAASIGGTARLSSSSRCNTIAAGISALFPARQSRLELQSFSRKKIILYRQSGQYLLNKIA
jgi:hypothetical protein